MLTTYDRYMREFRMKRLAARLTRDDETPRTGSDGVVPGYAVAKILRQAVKRTMRNMEGQ